DNPRFRQLLQRWVEMQQLQERDNPAGGDAQPGGTADKRMVELVEKFLKDAPKGGGFTTPNLLRQPDEGAPRQTPPINPPRQESSSPAVPIPPVSQPASRQEELREGLSNLIRKLGNSSLGESPTVRRIGRELNRPFFSRSDGESESEGILSKLPRLGEYVPFKRLFSGENLPSFGKPGWGGPRVPALSAPSAGGMQGPSEGTVIGLAWIGLAVIAAALLWKLLGGARRPPVAGQSAGRRLGPWRVHPADVAPRQDLVRAFEYLSLLLLGPAARAWNHVEIAGKLGASDDPAAMQRRNAASQLAGLYEQARYAPPDELL